VRAKTILLDCNYIAHQAFHTTGDLAYDGLASGVVFGFLSRVLMLGHKFSTNRFAFCWDSKQSLRKKIYPQYKSNRRKDLSPEDEDRYKTLWSQMEELSHNILPSIGFANVFERNGFEADDLIAALALSKDDKPAVIISADEDLFQCLSNKVMMYSPSSKKLWTADSFKQNYGIPPSLWSAVKAIAGCPGDNVAGVIGVGEKTAIKFLLGDLKKESKKYKDIMSRDTKSSNLNKRLVSLPLDAFPFDECPINMEDDVLELRGLESVAKDYGIETFLSDDGINRWKNLFDGNYRADQTPSKDRFKKMRKRGKT